MSRRYETIATVTIAGDERDVSVRAFIEVGREFGIGGCVGAAVDGDIELELSPNTWVDVDDVGLSRADLDLVENALCDAALEDDREVCVDWERAS